MHCDHSGYGVIAIAVGAPPTLIALLAVLVAALIGVTEAAS